MRNIDASETLAAPDLKVIQTGRDAGPGAQFTLFAQLRGAAQKASSAPSMTTRGCSSHVLISRFTDRAPARAP